MRAKEGRPDTAMPLLPVGRVDKVGVAGPVGGLEVNVASLGDVDDVAGASGHHTAADLDVRGRTHHR